MPPSKNRAPTERQLLKELRRICLALPGALETTTFGHPTWQAGAKRTFCVLEPYDDALTICFKTTAAGQAELLLHPAFTEAPYSGKHGWVALRTTAGVKGDRLEKLLEESFRLVAKKTDLRALEHLQLPRCDWTLDGVMRAYHDNEWGVPLRDERQLFEFLSLSGAQAGLSWRTVLLRRDAYRELFADFEVDKVARFTASRVEKLLGDERILRNRQKIESTIQNAKAARALRKDAGGLAEYLWSFVDGEPVANGWKSVKQMPAVTELSERVAADMKRRGFSFVGPTILYAYLQSVGIVNDHTTSCYRWAELTAPAKPGRRRKRGS